MLITLGLLIAVVIAIILIVRGWSLSKRIDWHAVAITIGFGVLLLTRLDIIGG